jgi:transporter family protein
MWLLLALLSAVSAALVAIFGKLGLSKIDTTLATTIRAIIMAAFLVVVALALNKFKDFTPSGISAKQWWYIVAAGVAGALSWLFYFGALKLGLATRVAAVDRLSVVFILVFSIVMLGEHLTWKNGLGALLMTGGAILMTIK